MNRFLYLILLVVASASTDPFTNKHKTTMKDYNEEYFFLGLVDHPSYPMLAFGDNFKRYARKFLQAEPIIYDEPIELKFREPVPRKPKMADYHLLSTPSPVFSEKLKNVIDKIKIRDIQFVPVLIRNEDDELIEGFSAIKVCNMIHCVDFEKSECDIDEDGDIDNIDKLVLDCDKLDKIPLEDRLIFAVAEKRTYVVYHISVVEKMLDSAPQGMTVYRLSGWDPSAPFYEVYGDYLKGVMK